MEPEGPIYSEKQAGAILRRAAELSEASAAGESTGVSLADMERIAGEIGIQPEHVREAASQVDQPEAGPVSGTVDLERVVPGELTDEVWEDVVAQLRRTFGDPGTVSQVGQAREWVMAGDHRRMHASLVSRAGRTRISMLWSHAGALATARILWAMFSFMLTFFSVVIGGKLGGPNQAALNFLVAAFCSGWAFFGISQWAQNWQRAQRARIEGLMSRIAGQLSRPVCAPAEVAAPVTHSAPETVEPQVIVRG